MELPLLQTKDQELSLMQTKWRSILNPFISLPSNQCSILPNVKLLVGSNVVNHLLGQKLTGWRIVRLRGLASIYDTQDMNQKPELTLILVSSANVSIDLEVF